MPADLRRHLTFSNVISVLALVIAVGGGAFAIAAIPAKDGTIHACYSKGSAALSVVGGNRCRPAEQPLRFNQRGAPGPAGQAGAQGLAGAPGSPAASMVIGNTDLPLTTAPFTANSFPPSGYTPTSVVTTNSTRQ